MPSVYLVAIYGLYHIAQMKRGQTVLLHSATGGVGIAAIQLCKHMGATVRHNVPNLTADHAKAFRYTPPSVQRRSANSSWTRLEFHLSTYFLREILSLLLKS